MTIGTPALREAIADWLVRRHGLPASTRRARYCRSWAAARRCSRSRRRCSTRIGSGQVVVMPNPFYQIYEGAALLGGATPVPVSGVAAHGFAPPWTEVPAAVWARTRLVYVCSPDNPTGRVTTLDEWRDAVRALRPPRLRHRRRRVLLGGVLRRGAAAAGRARRRAGAGTQRLPAAGDLRQPVQALERAGPALGLRRRRRGARQGVPALPHLPRLGDVAGGRRGEPRRLERRSARARQSPPTTPRSSRCCSRGSPRRCPARCPRPRSTSGPGRRSTTRSSPAACYAERNVTVLPGSYLGRSVDGANPGSGYVRVALVATRDECAEAIERIVDFARRL